MSFAALQSGWADLFVEALVESGVTDLVASPGSRSTPFVLAASRAKGLHTHVLIDERAAAFFALGLARRTGVPAALLCTSGTAAAHYFPAVIEAALSCVPLVAITADRPPELHDCSAPQTIDQTRLFGEFARGFFDLGVASDHPSALRGVRRKAAQAVARARGPVPGPVQVNAPARKPLEDIGDAADIDTALAARIDAARRAALPRPFATAPVPAAIDELVDAIRCARRGIIACGPAPVQQRDARDAVAALARATGFPVLVETTSQLRLGADIPNRCLAFDAALRSRAFRQSHAPDLIVELGAAPVSTGWRTYVAEHVSCTRAVISPYGWRDEHNAAAMMVSSDVGAACRALAGALAAHRPGPEASAWCSAFTDVDRRATEGLPPAAPEAPLSQARAIRAVMNALPDGAWLALGNSLSVRDVDAFFLENAADVQVLSQRGASGIDGLIAGAAGSAAAGPQPGVLVLGDVSFAHDIGGLAAARLVSSPLVVLVVDNAGGRIFEQLPVASLPSVDSTLERFWLTPPHLDVSSAATTFELPCHRARTEGELARALASGLETAGCTLVHATVDPASASRNYAAVQAAAAGSWRTQSHGADGNSDSDHTDTPVT